MILFFLLVSFWLNRIKPNPALLQLLCSELEYCYSPLLNDSRIGAALYRQMLITGESYWVCPFSGLVRTPFGLFYGNGEPIPIPHALDDTNMACSSVRFSVSKILRRTLMMINISLSLLVPRLLQRNRSGHPHRHAALMMHRIICMTASPRLSHQIQMLSQKFYGMRLVLHNVPRFGGCCGDRNVDIAFQNHPLNVILHTFLTENPGFPLTYQEVCWLIYWVYEQQMRLLAHDAALFGLNSVLIEHLEPFLNMDPNHILQIANRYGLLGHALSFFKLNKRKALEAERVSQRDTQVRWILRDIVEGAMDSSDDASAPAPAPKPSQDGQQYAEPYD